MRNVVIYRPPEGGAVGADVDVRRVGRATLASLPFVRIANSHRRECGDKPSLASRALDQTTNDDQVG